jgi:hypothetical protein
MAAMSRALRRAIAWQMVLATYMQAVSWIPLGRWNYQPCCPTGLVQLQRGALDGADIVGYAAFLLPLVSFWLGARRAWLSPRVIALTAYAVWLGLQLFTWWPPYLLGASERWQAVYARAFAESTHVLPRWGTHLPPDAMHLVLQILLVAVVVTGTSTLRRSSP